MHASGSVGALFKGKLYDEAGDRLTPSQTKKNGRVSRYYISNRLIRRKDPTGWRLPAQTLETTIIDAIRASLNDSAWQLGLLHGAEMPGIQALAKRIDDLTERQMLTSVICADMVSRVDLARGNISITLDRDKTAELLELGSDRVDSDQLILRAPLCLRRRGVEQKILIGDMKPEPNPVLVKCLADAHQWVARLKEGKPLAEVAHLSGIDPDYIRKRIKLASLSPGIQRAIINGTQPDHWSILALIRTRLPLSWEAQEKLLLADKAPNSLQA